MTISFIQQLEQRAKAVNSLLCVGLDPHPELLTQPTAAGVRDFCYRLIDATADLVCAFKPNSAFFEAFGAEGYAVLKQIIAHVPDGIPVILDAKRGDMSSTAEAYVRAAFDELGATAITLNPYLGHDAIDPFIARPEKGVFILCKTSNPSAGEFQDMQIDGQPLYAVIAKRALIWGNADNIGLVVGATDIPALANVRSIVPSAWFLVPGIGAQGGELRAVLQAGLRADGMGLLISASRSIAQATDPRVEALRLRDAINIDRNKERQSNPGENAILPLAQALADAGCVKFGSYKLKSGADSPIYLDLRRLVSYPKALRVVAESLNRLLSDLTFDHLAAIPYAALPIGTAATLLSGRSLIYPRKEVKDYGTKKQIEGVYTAGDTVVLVDDLATNGSSKFEAIAPLTAAGLIVKDIVVIIDREQGAAAALQAAGYRFHAVVTIRQLMDIWQAQGSLTAEQRREVDTYLAQLQA